MKNLSFNIKIIIICSRMTNITNQIRVYSIYYVKSVDRVVLNAQLCLL